MSDYIRHTWEDGEVITAEKMNNVEQGIAEAKKLAANAENIPVPTASDAGKAIIAKPDGRYGLGNPDVPASSITAGTLGGQVVANATAVADLSVAQVRNIVCGTADVADVLDSLNVGDIYFTVEEEA